MDLTADQFNARHPIGTPVIAYPGVRPEYAATIALLAQHRDQVLTEAAELITAASLARLEEIDEDDRRPSHWDRHGEWCEAATLLLGARTTKES